MSKVGRVSQFGKNTIQKISTTTNKYGQRYLPSTVVKGSRSVLDDAKRTTQYYRLKARRGWLEGQKISEKRQFSSPLSIITKTGYAIKETAKNLQLKDILPVIGAGAGFCTPLLGGWVLGYVAGKCLNQLGTSIAKGVKQLGKNLRHL